MSPSSDRSREDLVKEAYQAWDAEDWPRAAELMEAAVRVDPDARGADKLWFDAALAHKFLGNWQEAYDLGKEAAARATRGAQDPAFWNLGIAATMLRDWATARDSWIAYGINLPDGDGEIVANLGMTCVRINTATGQEVVWAQRLCPTRAVVRSVPFDTSRRRGEVVLHDGAPNGERIVAGTRFAVFDEIMLFEPSDVATLSVTVTATTADDLEALLVAFEEADFGAEPTNSAQLLCACCSQESIEVERATEAGQQVVLIAAPEPRAHEILDAWRTAAPDRRGWRGLHLAA
ncbi:hypothetical protein Ais01nite_14230 [Asanoa ishikariensis]|uniref:Tetratricopeptide repeat-containing protein n=1 Tax=Asanoa ishikariensis TaxID=137265 RepID=A0A1H3UK44_9ACTN|nr:hypothetical protein [Asanoa ishikariensis]GIF63388.1 hypothetical protein Ais01nite_14230 [Asanoa ishikariensis]SDZ62391.1 hypothetical protein SAMN05421684_7450 [Asanoa ishikariensis]